MHRLDRLKSAVADIRAHPEVKLHAALSVLLSKLVFQLAALLHQIFCLPKGGILAHQSVSSQSGSPFDSRCHWQQSAGVSTLYSRVRCTLRARAGTLCSPKLSNSYVILYAARESHKLRFCAIRRRCWERE